MWWFVCAVTLTLAWVAHAQNGSINWDVTIDQGTVRGYRSPNGAYYTFLGIPYATAPTGPFRFQGPLAAPPWDGILESTYDGILCSQRDVGEEQCLVLNVFVPMTYTSSGNPVPVLVYVHGGAYIVGNGPTYGTSNLVERDVIVVTFNYRLGVLGFLCLGTEQAPGNAGMKDQVAALRWVKRNIASFGGDPKAVTLYGLSAGAASVDLLVLSNSTNGLFHQAIMESGSALLPWSVDRDPIGTAKNLATSIGFNDTDDLALLTDFYQRVPANVLASANYRYYSTLTDATFGFAPCIEEPSSTAFLTEDPMSILEKGSYEAVPILAAYCDAEGFFRASDFYEKNWKDKMEANFSGFLPGDLHFDSEEEKKLVADTVKTAYFGEAAVSEETARAYVDYFGDTTFSYGILKSALLHARASKPVFLMEFSYEGRLNQDKPYFRYIHGAGHADIYPYLFQDFRPSLVSDFIAFERITCLWKNFILYGEPTRPESLLIPVLWPPMEQNSALYLSFGTELGVYGSPNRERAAFWDAIYELYYRPARPVVLP